MGGNGPYRDGQPLDALIAPDHRRRNAALLLLAGALLGGAVFVVASQLHERGSLASASAAMPSDVVPPPPRVRLSGITLDGPGGRVVIPQGKAIVLHAWVQNRPDCMPGFRAAKDLAAAGGLHLRVPIVNVALGDVDPAWAASYGVADKLVVDRDGKAIFAPLGVEGFTTFVVDGAGEVRFSDRPDRPGYAARLERVVAELTR